MVERNAIFVVAVIAGILPLFLAGPVPALLDYPNHVARMSILMRAETSNANPHFDVAWSFMPNLAMDLIVPPIGRIVGIERASLLFLIAIQLLVVGGAAALEFAVKGRFVWAGYAALLLLYGQPFAWGFVNFQFGLGIALFGFAGWIHLSRYGWARPALWHASMCLALFMSHLFALGIYGWAVGLHELWRWQRERVALSRRVAAVVILVAPALVLLAVTQLSGGAIGGSQWMWFLTSKAMGLQVANGFSLTTSLMISVTGTVFLYLAWREGYLHLLGAGVHLAIGFSILFVIMPSRLLDTALVDIRVVLAAALIMPAFMDLSISDAKRRALARCLFAAMIATTIATTAYSQWSYRSTYSSLLTSFGHLPKNAKVLLAYGNDEDDLPANQGDYPLHHVGTLAVLQANAFVPSLFMHPGKQPIQPARAVRRLAGPDGGPTPMSILRNYIDDPLRAQGQYDYLSRWASDFDFLCVFDTTGRADQNPIPALLAPVAQGHRFVLYRIIKA